MICDLHGKKQSDPVGREKQYKRQIRRWSMNQNSNWDKWNSKPHITHIDLPLLHFEGSN